MRTLIFGAGGQLGRDLITVFKSGGEAQGHDLPAVDITDDSQVYPLVTQYGPDIIVNAAAFTQVDQAEDELEAAFMTNESGARNLAEIAAHHEIPIVYFSTDYVFDGTADTPYKPDDPMAPLGVYGKSKAAGEAATRKANPRHFIVRTAWLYGPGGNNFVEKILRAAASRPSLRVVEDEVGSPTHTLDLAEVTYYLARTHAFGAYHAVNSGACSRYEFAREILKLAESRTAVEPCAASEYPSKAPRPAYSVLDTAKIEEATAHPMRSWQKALAHYMERRESRT